MQCMQAAAADRQMHCMSSCTACMPTSTQAQVSAHFCTGEWQRMHLSNGLIWAHQQAEFVKHALASNANFQAFRMECCSIMQASMSSAKGARQHLWRPVHANGAGEAAARGHSLHMHWPSSAEPLRWRCALLAPESCVQCSTLKGRGERCHLLPRPS